MKRSVLAALLLTGLCAACSSPTNSANDPGQATTVVFDNTRGICAVAVYDSHQRREADKIAEIPAGSSSTEIKWTPSNSYPFYFTYLVTLAGISDIVIPYVPAVGKDQVAVRIDENKRTVVPVPALEETLTTADELLSSDSYIIIQNVSSYPFQLLENNSSLKPDNSPNSAVVNSGETASYKIIPGTASVYSLRVGAALTGLGSFGSFEAGHIYRLYFDGYTAGLTAETEIKPENIPPPNSGGIAQYTVSYDANGASGTPPDAQTVNAGGSVVVAGQGGMRYSGYVFSGWNTDADGTGTSYNVGALYTPAGTSTLYARWIPGVPVQYTVTFGAEGGTPPAQTKTVDSGASVGSSDMPSDPTKSGYIFGGWYTAINGGGIQFTATTVVTRNITVYATWTLDIQYTVTFDAEGGTPPTQTKTVTNGSFVGSSNMPSEPAKTGYVFDGWYTAANGGGTRFTGLTVVTGDIIVYAKWTIIQYTVTFSAGGGTPATQTKTVNSGGSIGSSNMPVEPTRSGYAFGGWYTAQNGGGTRFTETTPVTGNTTVYAAWIVQYTITYNANGASGTPPTVQTVSAGSSVTLAGQGGLTRPGYSFSGWWNTTDAGTETPYGAGTSYTPAGSVTLYAQWTSDLPGTLSLNDALTWVSNNAVEGGSYPIAVKNNETVPSRTLSYGGKTVTVILKGDATERIVSSTANGTLFDIESGVTLTLDNNITLQGRSGNTAPLVFVASGGTLVMNTGSKISGNTSSSSGGGVRVSSGTFTMNDGTISGNTAFYGGGVHVYSGTFTMNNGTISGNTSSSIFHSCGGGVYVEGGTFTMSGGTISGNISSSSSSSNGGGVFVEGGTFTMSGGTISGNTSSSSSFYGGGVYVGGGSFTMSGGTISGHTTAKEGGGVYVGSGTFVKQQSGGIIYGSNESDSTLKNTATSGNSYGHAVYVYSGGKVRNTTAGVGVTLDSSLSGPAGGWE